MDDRDLDRLRRILILNAETMRWFDRVFPLLAGLLVVGVTIMCCPIILKFASDGRGLLPMCTIPPAFAFVLWAGRFKALEMTRLREQEYQEALLRRRNAHTMCG